MIFEKLPTEQILQNWRYGSTQAERLLASILTIEGFQEVDPQNPLGGPDGLKDVLCKRSGLSWIAACYFPPTSSNFKQILAKFRSDFKGVSRNKANGFIFLTNQRLSPGERSELAKVAKPYSTEIYHLERLRTILDSPKGYGLRLEYLRIAMNDEEQVSFWSQQRESLTERYSHQENAIKVLHEKMDELMHRTMNLHTNLAELPSSMLGHTELRVSLADYYPTSSLTVEQLLWLQRSLADEKTVAAYGLRRVEVWIGGAIQEKATFVPIQHTLIRPQLDVLLESWRREYPRLIGSDRRTVVEAVAQFHYNFLRIHPFLDGNGRVSRSILQQQVKELLGKELYAIFTDDPEVYYSSLKNANEGDLSHLIQLIDASLE